MLKSNEENNVNQADELKQLFEEIEREQSNHLHIYTDDEPKIDILNLPPRKEVHNQEQKLLRIPLNKSLLRFLFVIILIGIILYVLITNDYINLF